MGLADTRDDGQPAAFTIDLLVNVALPENHVRSAAGTDVMRRTHGAGKDFAGRGILRLIDQRRSLPLIAIFGSARIDFGTVRF